MTAPRVSVVVVSRDRPAELRRCLSALRLLYARNFELVVVACPRGLDAISDGGADLKRVPFDTPNISDARNAGVAAAGGDLLAFVDDDAVPRPGWLDRLATPLIAGQAACSGGPVIGRNGFSLQWGPREVNGLAEHRDAQPGWSGDPDWAPKVEGTNFAILRQALSAVGGFDARYHFYLDETDLCLRLYQDGYLTAYVPEAVVHHGVAAGHGRAADRTPTDLFEIGASLAVYAGAHGGGEVVKTLHRDAQRVRLLRFMREGRLPPTAVGRLLRRFDEGWSAGSARTASPVMAETGSDFLPFAAQGHTSDPLYLRAHWSKRSAVLSSARAAHEEGRQTHVLLWSATPLDHHLSFVEGVGWVQTGGLWGRTSRAGMRPLKPSIVADLTQLDLFSP